MENDIAIFLSEELKRKKKNNSRYSLRSYARDLGVSPATLSKIISGQALLSPKIFQKIRGKLPYDRKTLLQIEKDLIARKKHRDHRSSEIINERSLSPSEFKLIYQWYNWAILEAFSLHDFKSDPNWIRKKLNLKNTVTVERALHYLKRLELIKDAAHGLVPNFHFLINVGEDPAFAIQKRKKQEQIVKMSLKALRKNKLDIRNHTDICIALDDALIPIVKKKVLRFNRELAKLINNKSVKMNKIYIFQTGLFPISE